MVTDEPPQGPLSLGAGRVLRICQHKTLAWQDSIALPAVSGRPAEVAGELFGPRYGVELDVPQQEAHEPIALNREGRAEEGGCERGEARD